MTVASRTMHRTGPDAQREVDAVSRSAVPAGPERPPAHRFGAARAPMKNAQLPA